MNTFLLKRAKEALAELEKLGAKWQRKTNVLDFRSIRVRNNDQALRLVRALRLVMSLERRGVLHADIDRMGTVVGCHYTQAAREEMVRRG